MTDTIQDIALLVIAGTVLRLSIVIDRAFASNDRRLTRIESERTASSTSRSTME